MTIPVTLLALLVWAAPVEFPPLHVPASPPRPSLPDFAALDGNHDGLEDGFGAVLRDARPDVPLEVEFVFRRALTPRDLEVFTSKGGRLRWVFQSVSFGFLGTIAPARLGAVLQALGREAVLVAGNAPMRHDVDHATRNARAREVWKAGFANRDAGFEGSPTTTIGIIDTGLDDSHPDLAGRLAYWQDFEGTEATPRDLEGHGTCVASIALGSGAAFEASAPDLKLTRGTAFDTIVAGSVAGRTPMRVEAPMTLRAQATFDGASTTKVSLSWAGPPAGAARPYTTRLAITGDSPIALNATLTPVAGEVLSLGLTQSSPATLTWGNVTSTLTPWPQATDGKPTMRGLAPGCRWASAHAADNVMTVEMALDDLMTQRQAINLKVINISQSPDTAGATLIPAKFKTLAEGGVLIVKTAGNNGRSPTNPFITASGLTALVLTVGATNLENQLTSYTSTGTGFVGVDQDLKPDLLAPGGSLLSIDLKCADSNDADKPDGGIADLVPDDYQFEEGTSFAAPVVAGASALVIQAIEAQGATWDWSTSASPRRVKAVLLATATETGRAREAPPSLDPPVGRDVTQKDRAEGYGMINVDAAIEGVSLDLALPLTGDTAAGPFDRRAWARRVNLVAGTPLSWVLVPPAQGDFDLYLYDAAPDAKGNPVLLAAAAAAMQGGFERFDYTPTASGVGLLVIKRLAGAGAWRLVAPGVCGDGQLEAGEDCDDGNRVDGDCCGASCLYEATGQQCPAGACTLGVCQAPLCGDGQRSFPETCDDRNIRNGDCCSSTCVLDADGTPCTGGACVAGACVPPVTLPEATLNAPAARSCASVSGAPEWLLLAAWVLARRRRG